MTGRRPSVQQATMVPGDFIQGKSAAPGGRRMYPVSSSRETGGGRGGMMPRESGVPLRREMMGAGGGTGFRGAVRDEKIRRMRKGPGVRT